MTATRRVMPAFVAGACVASGAAYLLPATYNYVITPIVATFDVQESESALLRQVAAVSAQSWSGAAVSFLSVGLFVWARRRGRRIG